MDEINKLKIICRKLSIPFWYCNQSHSYNEKYSLCFSVKKCNLRILCSLWNYYGEFNPNVLFQYFSFDDRDNCPGCGYIRQEMCRIPTLICSGKLAQNLHKSVDWYPLSPE